MKTVGIVGGYTTENRALPANVDDPGALRQLLHKVLILLGVGLAASAVSLAHHAPTFCTSSARDWPLGIVVYPCPCYGMGDRQWFIDPLGLMLNTLFFAATAGALSLLVAWLRRRNPPRAAASGGALTLTMPNPKSPIRNPKSQS